MYCTGTTEAMDELDPALAAAGEAPDRPPGGLYDNELFSDERGRWSSTSRSPAPPPEERSQPLVIPAAELATTVHPGAHDDIDVTYGALGTYVSSRHSKSQGQSGRSTTSDPATATTARYLADRDRLADLPNHQPSAVDPTARCRNP